MAEEKRKILVLVEGATTDVALMERLLSVYQIVRNHDYRQFAATQRRLQYCHQAKHEQGLLIRHRKFDLCAESRCREKAF